MNTDDILEPETNALLQNSPTTTIGHYVQSASKAASTEELIKIIQSCFEAPGVYVFGELLVLPNVVALKQGPHAKYVHTLNLFAHGTFREYLSNKDTFVEFTAVMVRKLQHLTIVSMFIKSGKCIPYNTLLDELQINSVRNLEDLIIDSLSSNIIQGKLDQKNKQLEVDNAIGRDIKSEDMSQIVSTLQDWCDSCETVLGSIELQIKRANSEKQKRLKHKDAIEQEIINLKKAIKTQSTETDEIMVGDSREAGNAYEVRKKPSKVKSGKSSGKSWFKNFS